MPALPEIKVKRGEKRTCVFFLLDDNRKLLLVIWKTKVTEEMIFRHGFCRSSILFFGSRMPLPQPKKLR
jgi:hypothetical protein